MKKRLFWKPPNCWKNKKVIPVLKSDKLLGIVTEKDLFGSYKKSFLKRK